MTCNWNWLDVIQGLHNVLFSLFKAKSKFQTEFRRNGKYLRSQSPSFSTVHTSKKSSFPLRSAVTAAKHPHSPLKDIPQKTLVRGAVNVRGSLIRAVICHFKRSTLWKLCYQRRLTAVARCCSSWKEFNLTLSNVPASARTGAWPFIQPLPGNAVTSSFPLRMRRIWLRLKIIGTSLKLSS